MITRSDAHCRLAARRSNRTPSSLIQSILDFYHAEVERRIPPKKTCSALCDSVILGGMWRHLQSTGRASLPKAATDYTGSANGLLWTLGSMFGRLPRLPDHDTCSPAKRYREFENAARQRVRYQDPLEPHHTEQLEKIARNAGFHRPGMPFSRLQGKRGFFVSSQTEAAGEGWARS
jgi:hypothetical protein